MSEKDQPSTVYGYQLSSPRLTGHGKRQLLLRYGLPLLIAALMLDGALWLYFHYALGQCYGLFCLFN